MVADEETPERAVKSKNFIQKVMFMTAVARPCWDHVSKKMFDGNVDGFFCTNYFLSPLM